MPMTVSCTLSLGEVMKWMLCCAFLTAVSCTYSVCFSIKQMTLLSLLTAAIWTRAEGLAIMLMARGLLNTALMSLSNSAARCSKIVGMAFNV